MLLKTGECFFRDENGNLFVAESFIDSKGVVTTEVTPVLEEVA